MIQVRVLFFASLRERFENAEQTLNIPDRATARSLWELASGGAKLPENLLCARNQEYVDLDVTLTNGDEIAFFPPVTGG